jgi:hypothetical protein
MLFTTQGELKLDQLLVIVICISRPRNHFLTYREKNCVEDVKGLRGLGIHNIFCAKEN